MIYVDDYQLPALVRGKQRHWSHLMSVPRDDDALHAFAKSIGLKRSWFQPKSYPHYDVTDWMRDRAIQAGAIEIGSRELARLRTGSLDKELIPDKWDPEDLTQLRATKSQFEREYLSQNDNGGRG